VVSSESMLFNLKELDLFSVGIQSPDNQTSSISLANFPQLSSLNLSHNKFDSVDRNSVFSCLILNFSKTLRDLKLVNCELKVNTDEIQPNLIRLIRSMQFVEFLDISQNDGLVENPLSMIRILTQLRIACPNLRSL
jgi:hypothetical protein